MPTGAERMDITIIGAGFSGTLTAVHLVRARSDIRVTLVERSGRFGPGLAYSTPDPSHLLNVPAGNMSAFDDQPSHFLDWARSADPSIHTGSFVRRSLYGEYIRSVLDAARSAHPDRIRLCHDEALRGRWDNGSWHVELRSGEALTSAALVLALGNTPPQPPPGADVRVFGHAGYVSNPWNVERLRAIDAGASVLLIGAGLTMVDAVLTLRDRGHTGPMTAISRHGVAPRTHRSPSKPPVGRRPPEALDRWDGSALGMLRILRAAVADGAAAGADWREAVNSIRTITPQLWSRMAETERSRFLRRLRSYWEVVRHRAAPEIGALIADLMAARRLKIRPARLESLAPAGAKLEARFRPRGSEQVQRMIVDAAINCLGPDTDLSRSADPLTRQLLDSGIVRTDALRLGLLADPEGRPLGADGRPVPGMIIVGPWRRAQHWEATAVPELRKQTLRAAGLLAGPSR
ncbi:MAG: FAD/NAD(P)-binding protein [Phycisphaerae bacterium]|nr:FAD/NAD(P)-binding protein [Phycisphaerae bacterium]